MRTLTTVAVTLALTGATLAGTAGAAGVATTPGTSAKPTAVCSTPWGSGTKSDMLPYASPLTNIRTGQHDCYDRIVFDVPNNASAKVGYHVDYVTEFYEDGTGDPIPVTGGAILRIFASTPSYDPETGRATYPARPKSPLPGVNLTGYRTFKDTKFGGSFEGRTQVGLGVRAKLPFRVTQTKTQLIVDVAHTW
ncbi:hypothetical protein [Streptomyces sp. NPDC058953]|uniref:AMIN-like domain-containing (lipo)protein n=1 Tax=unclassified Streptomyces TaxID=2593676 RepID=UPI0036B9E1EA